MWLMGDDLLGQGNVHCKRTDGAKGRTDTHWRMPCRKLRLKSRYSDSNPTTRFLWASLTHSHDRSTNNHNVSHIIDYWTHLLGAAQFPTLIWSVTTKQLVSSLGCLKVEAKSNRYCTVETKSFYCYTYHACCAFKSPALHRQEWHAHQTFAILPKMMAEANALLHDKGRKVIWIPYIRWYFLGPWLLTAAPYSVEGPMH